MASARALVRLERLIWVLIYAGLFTLVLGVASRASHAPAGWSLIAVGGVLAAAGAVLIWVRSRLQEDRPGQGGAPVSSSQQGKT